MKRHKCKTAPHLLLHLHLHKITRVATLSQWPIEQDDVHHEQLRKCIVIGIFYIAHNEIIISQENQAAVRLVLPDKLAKHTVNPGFKLSPSTMASSKPNFKNKTKNLLKNLPFLRNFPTMNNINF